MARGRTQVRRGLMGSNTVASSMGGVIGKLINPTNLDANETYNDPSLEHTSEGTIETINDHADLLANQSTNQSTIDAASDTTMARRDENSCEAFPIYHLGEQANSDASVSNEAGEVSATIENTIVGTMLLTDEPAIERVILNSFNATIEPAIEAANEATNHSSTSPTLTARKKHAHKETTRKKIQSANEGTYEYTVATAKLNTIEHAKETTIPSAKETTSEQTNEPNHLTLDSLEAEASRLEKWHTNAEQKIYKAMLLETTREESKDWCFTFKRLTELTGLKNPRTLQTALDGLVNKLSIEWLSGSRGSHLGKLYRVFTPDEVLEKRKNSGIKIHPQTKKIV